MSDKKRRQYDACFNPFNEENYKFKKRKFLRRVTRAMLVKLKLENIDLSSQLKVCDICRVKISKLPNPEHISEQCIPGSSSQNLPEPNSHESTESGDTNSSGTVSVKEAEERAHLSIVNESLVSLGETPIKKIKLNQKHYPRHKLQRIESKLKEKVFHNIESDSTSDEKPDNIHDSSDIVQKLIDSFHATEDRNLKVQILTIFESWSYSKIKEHF